MHPIHNRVVRRMGNRMERPKRAAERDSQTATCRATEVDNQSGSRMVRPIECAVWCKTPNSKGINLVESIYYFYCNGFIS